MTEPSREELLLSEVPSHPWNPDSVFRAAFNVLLTVAAVLAGLHYVMAIPHAIHAVTSTASLANTADVAGGGVTGGGVEIPPLEPIPGTPTTTTKIPWWVFAYFCTLIFLWGLLLVLLHYIVGKWLEAQERRCRGRRKWWQRLLCFLATFLKWISFIMSVAILIGAIIFLIVCVLVTLV